MVPAMSLDSVVVSITRRAIRLCEADDVAILLRDRNAFSTLVHERRSRATAAKRGERPIDRSNAVQRAFTTRRTTRGRSPTLVATPLSCNGHALGVMVARRAGADAFTAPQVALLQTLAEHAAAALENARLGRELREATERERATADILGVISGSPTDVQPV